MENIFWHCKKLTKFSFPSPKSCGECIFPFTTYNQSFVLKINQGCSHKF
jgi:hypothetical protein